MEVKILKSISSQSYSYATGETVKLEKARADEFIKYGIARPVVETNVNEAKETAKEAVTETEKETKTTAKEAADKKKPAKKKGESDADDS